jgi:hypothetical protein
MYIMQVNLSLLRVNLETIHESLREDLGKRKNYTKFVRHSLADEHDSEALPCQSRRCGDQPSTLFT